MSDDAWAGLPNGNYQKWENPGDSIAGDVIGKGVGQDVNGADVPQLVILRDDGEEITVTAGQAQLRAKLMEANPNVGDRCKIEYTRSEDRGGGKTLKHFEVNVKRGGAKNAPPAAAEVAASDDDF